jgi:plastocyanin
MKHLIILLAVQSFFIINSATATVHIITASGTTLPTDVFAPKNLSAVVGDTIKWVWVSGVHTTESVNIPAGAASWFADLTSTDTVFYYVLTVAGNYYYDCHKLTLGGHGMDGNIAVSELSTGIDESSFNTAVITYPNPFSNKLFIKAPDAESIFIYNAAGQKIKTVGVNGAETELDVADLATGIYFYNITFSNNTIEKGKLLKK